MKIILIDRDLSVVPAMGNVQCSCEAGKLFAKKNLYSYEDTVIVSTLV